MHVDFPCVSERPDSCTAHSRCPNSPWHSESQAFYHICSLQSTFPYQRRAFQAVCLPPATITRLCPHVRSLSASGIILLETDATLSAVLHRQGVFAGLSANQCEHAVILMSLRMCVCVCQRVCVGWCWEPMSIIKCFCWSYYFSSVLI